MPKQRKQRAPLVIHTNDISPQDLGSGYRLNFQRSTKDPKQVRAVIKDSKGEIYATGDVVDESNALASRMRALNNARTRTFNSSLGLPPDATARQQNRAILELAESMGVLPPSAKKELRDLKEGKCLEDKQALCI